MKRILSLVLVLVMLVSVMPFALAEDNPNGPGTVSVSTVSELKIGNSHTVTVTACATANNSTVLEGDQLNAVELSLSSSNTDAVTVSGNVITAVGAGDATITVNATYVGNYTNRAETSFDVTVPAAEETTYKASAAPLTVSVGGKGSVVITYKNGETVAEDVKPSGVTYAVTEGKDYATVDSNGVVTGLKKGEATVTATVTGVKGVDYVTCKVTVTDGPTIVFPADQTTQTRYTSVATITLKPELSEKVEGEVTWTFATNSKTATVGQTSGVVDPSAAGAVEVTITAAWGDPAAKASTQTKVSVSFYDIVDATVSVASKATTFGFWDTDVFSSVSIDNSSVALPSGYSMANLWSSKISYTDVKLSPENKTNSAAQISYKNSAIQSPTSIPLVNERTIVFTCLSKGTFEFEYELFDNGLLVRYGVITVYTVEGGADLTYTTTFNKNVVFDEDDFVKLWNKSSNKSKLDYVQFTTNSLTGDLYVSSEKNAYAVSSNMKFYYDYNSAIDKGFNDYDLDLVTYVPYSKATKAYEETISFTCVGETFSETLSGVLVIKVGNTMNFTDVKTTDYFYDAVVWAVDQGVTSGTSATTFSPNKTCSRAEVVTFLWRAAGEPKPTSTYMPFSDVKVTDYYYDAVRWAVEEKVTTGTSATTFSPNATVTRGQVVTFLYRALKDSSVSTTNPFTDVKSGEYYYDAVLWAVKNDVTNGLTATTFGPNTGCTRGQIVTFLYRAYEG